MRSAWKRLHYVTPGGLPLGGGTLWSISGSTTVVHRGRGWMVQKVRPYYYTAGALSLFVETAVSGRPIRDKFAQLRRRRRRPA